VGPTGSSWRGGAKRRWKNAQAFLQRQKLARRREAPLENRLRGSLPPAKAGAAARSAVGEPLARFSPASQSWRGGAWNNDMDNARVANRNRNNPNNWNDNIGFRVVAAHTSLPALCQ
jgi:hypothetical protein